MKSEIYITGADPGILEWWGYMTNAPIKTTPIFIAQRGSNMSADCTTNSLENGFTTCLELGQINQCIPIAKHVSSTAFCIVTLTIWGGGVATPETSPSRSAPALVLLCISSLYRYFITHMEIDSHLRLCFHIILLSIVLVQIISMYTDFIPAVSILL